MVHVLARPVRTNHELSGTYIQPYRGYGSREEIYMIGRLIRQMGPLSKSHRTSFSADLYNIFRRTFRMGVGNGKVEATVGNTSKQFDTDSDGYFKVRMKCMDKIPPNKSWQDISLQLVQPDGHFETTGTIYVAPENSKRVIVSDIDDTVMYTGVANKMKMVYRLFAQNAENRAAFPGVGAFYKALHEGLDDEPNNPMLYLSRAPWSIYEVLDEFFNTQNIPIGPVLLLREWGITWKHPLPKRGKNHKINLLREIFDIYHDKEIILIGDSGQHDTATYAQMVQDHPNRVKAVYIRDVSNDKVRAEEIHKVSDKISGSGTSLLLASDTFAMAEHAHKHGLITEESLKNVLREREKEKEIEQSESV